LLPSALRLLIRALRVPNGRCYEADEKMRGNSNTIIVVQMISRSRSVGVGTYSSYWGI
jgi:hypothetical protein